MSRDGILKYLRDTSPGGFSPFSVTQLPCQSFHIVNKWLIPQSLERNRKHLPTKESVEAGISDSAGKRSSGMHHLDGAR